MITEASGILDEGSKAVINQQDQYQVWIVYYYLYQFCPKPLPHQVFDDPGASDPSHSLLSKVRDVTLPLFPSYPRFRIILPSFSTSLLGRLLKLSSNIVSV